MGIEGSKDMQALWRLMADVKNDNAHLWTQIVQLRDQLEASKVLIMDLTKLVTDLMSAEKTKSSLDDLDVDARALA
jgi:hypothetical protein